MYQKLFMYQLIARRMTAAAAAVIAAGVFSYGAFLLMAVERTAARAEAQAQAQALSAALGELQSQYLAAEEGLTPERAAELGFVTPPQSAALFADASAPSLSLRTGAAQ